MIIIMLRFIWERLRDGYKIIYFKFIVEFYVDL